jgi:5-methylcytosine-specific restriction endonuclease McrA
MSNFVFLIDTNKQALDPIPSGQARRLLNQNVAAVYRRYPFTLILKHSVINAATKPYQLKIDPGSKVTGLAIVQEDKVIWGAELCHRGQQIKNDLESRRAIRRSRRNRKTRYRKARFLNRTRPQGWLAPSLQSRVENILTWVKRIRKYVPIAGISQEFVRFDTQAMQNAEISGKEYQQGELAGYEVREYLLLKWGRKCTYCGSSDTRLEVEHIHPKCAIRCLVNHGNQPVHN